MDEKKLIRLTRGFLGLLLITTTLFCTSCGPGSLQPEADLWGEWSLTTIEGGNSTYAYDLKFGKDGNLVFLNHPQLGEAQITYVVIAPGRIKITFEQQTDILNYELVDDTLRLFCDQGYVLYQRQTRPKTVSGDFIESLEESTQTAQKFTAEVAVSTPSQKPLVDTPSPIPSITPTLTPTFRIGSRRVNTIDQAEMVYVPAGYFMMGSETVAAGRNERPARDVYLDGFWIYTHPVTNQHFSEFTEQTGFVTDAEYFGRSWVFEFGSRLVVGAYWRAPEGGGSHISGREEYPVVHISYDDAAAYCAWADGRLPSEAEWEKAARGEKDYMYPWGNSQVSGEKANFCDTNCPMEWADRSFNDGYARTSPVGSFPQGASIYGALDMSGNVWEWVADWYSSTYYATAPFENPPGPDSGENRVIRGGSWVSSAKYLRASYRNWSDPYDASNDHGFRCVVTQIP